MTKQKAVDESTAGGRVNMLLRKIWGNSQSKMAKEIGVSQAAISNVVTGKRPPGRNILSCIAAHPLVNAGWLLTGEGSLCTLSPSQPTFLPIAKEPLPGSPAEHRQYLSDYAPVAEADYADGRYWLASTTDRFAKHGILVGDRLLITTDRSWLTRPQMIVGQPCVVADERGATLQWLRYAAEEKPHGALAVDVTEGGVPQQSGTYVRRPRAITLSKLEAETKQGADPAEPKPAEEARKARKESANVTARQKSAANVENLKQIVPLTAIVGVAIKLERRFGVGGSQ